MSMICKRFVTTMKHLEQRIFGHQFQGQSFEIVAETLRQHLNSGVSTFGSQGSEIMYLYCKTRPQFVHLSKVILNINAADLTRTHTIEQVCQRLNA